MTAKAENDLVENINSAGIMNNGGVEKHRNDNYGLAVNTSYKGELNTTNPSGFGSAKEAKSMKNVVHRAQNNLAANEMVNNTMF